MALSAPEVILALSSRKDELEEAAMSTAVAPEQQLMTAEEFFEFCQRPENRDRHLELERGKIVEMPPPGERHGVVCWNAAGLLWMFALHRGKGVACTNDTGLVLEREPDTVNGPDVLFFDKLVRYDQLAIGYPQEMPHLVVEVLSPSARHSKVVRRVSRLLRKGVALVWVLDPEDRSVTVYRAGREAVVLSDTDEVTGEDVIPDLRLKVADFFKLPGGG
jgi:Uma2 family endonuclease